MKNKKQKQSSLYKMKAIHEHIRQSKDEQIRQAFGSFYADNQLYEIFKAPSNIHFGYKVINWCYRIKIDDIDGEMVKGHYEPIYRESKAIKY